MNGIRYGVCVAGALSECRVIRVVRTTLLFLMHDAPRARCTKRGRLQNEHFYLEKAEEENKKTILCRKEGQREK